MSHLVQFVKQVRSVLTPGEWMFFCARFIDNMPVGEASAMAFPDSRLDPDAINRAILRKVRDTGRGAV